MLDFLLPGVNGGECEGAQIQVVELKMVRTSNARPYFLQVLQSLGACKGPLIGSQKHPEDSCI
jgi:hypothetical protein